jgi:hypothetical protein
MYPVSVLGVWLSFIIILSSFTVAEIDRLIWQTTFSEKKQHHKANKKHIAIKNIFTIWLSLMYFFSFL